MKNYFQTDVNSSENPQFTISVLYYPVACTLVLLINCFDFEYHDKEYKVHIPLDNRNNSKIDIILLAKVITDGIWSKVLPGPQK